MCRRLPLPNSLFLDLMAVEEVMAWRSRIDQLPRCLCGAKKLSYEAICLVCSGMYRLQCDFLSGRRVIDNPGPIIYPNRTQLGFGGYRVELRVIFHPGSLEEVRDYLIRENQRAKGEVTNKKPYIDFEREIQEKGIEHEDVHWSYNHNLDRWKQLSGYPGAYRVQSPVYPLAIIKFRDRDGTYHLCIGPNAETYVYYRGEVIVLPVETRPSLTAACVNQLKCWLQGVAEHESSAVRVAQKALLALT